MKRTFTAIVCTLLLVAVLAGCGSTNPFDAAAKTFSDEGMTITLTSDFSKQSMDGYTVCYAAKTAAVFALHETNDQFAAAGLNDVTLEQYAAQAHSECSGGREELSLTYQTVSSVSDPTAAPQKILEQLRDHQERHRQAELDSRQCLSGPHKDDLLVELDGRSAKTYGSQGQTRTAALSLKLAQRDIFFQETGEYPVLLLDDVLSELDARRQAFVLNHIQGGQIFITCCEEEKLEGLEGGAAFHIHGGALV